VLFSFCAGAPQCADGANPEAGLIMDAAGHLYGTTSHGGEFTSNGTVFELTPNAAKTKWTETVLYRFCTLARCADGAYPFAGLIMDSAGHLYGTTYYGGLVLTFVLPSYGTVFELTPNTTHTKWTERVIHSFCAGGVCTDGIYPAAGLIRRVRDQVARVQPGKPRFRDIGLGSRTPAQRGDRNNRHLTCRHRPRHRATKAVSVAAGAADDRETDRQTVDRGARQIDLRHAGEPAIGAQAEDAITLRARDRERLVADRIKDFGSDRRSSKPTRLDGACRYRVGA
jgi:uncharacterized repeat protein (TIGR03803 family)